MYWIKYTIVLIFIGFYTNCKNERGNEGNNYNYVVVCDSLLKQLKAPVYDIPSDNAIVWADQYIHNKMPTVDITAILQSLLDRHDFIVLPNFSMEIDDVGLTLKSNQTLFFQEKTALHIKPNDKKRHELLRIHNVKNVQIINPVLRGDRQQHIGSDGEHGFGISIKSSENIYIKNFDVRDFFGDGIYVGMLKYSGPNKNIRITNGIVDNNRRNGISIISVEGLFLENVIASNSNGTRPMFGIDIEPNRSIGHQMREVHIKDVITFNNARGGFMLSIQKLAMEENKKVTIHLENYKDYYSYYGFLFGGLPSDYNKLSGNIKLQNIQLHENEIPLSLKNNPSKTFLMEVYDLDIVNPKNKNAHTNEANRILKIRNIEVD